MSQNKQGNVFFEQPRASYGVEKRGGGCVQSRTLYNNVYLQVRSAFLTQRFKMVSCAVMIRWILQRIRQHNILVSQSSLFRNPTPHVENGELSKLKKSLDGTSFLRYIIIYFREVFSRPEKSIFSFGLHWKTPAVLYTLAVRRRCEK